MVRSSEETLTAYCGVIVILARSLKEPDRHTCSFQPKYLALLPGTLAAIRRFSEGLLNV